MRPGKNQQAGMYKTTGQDEKYLPKFKKSMSDGKFKTYGSVTGQASAFRR